MAYKVVRKEDAAVRQIAHNKIAINYISKDISPNFSFAVTKAEDYFEEEIANYDRIYFILKGKLELTIEGTKIRLNEYDSCLVSKGTKYIMKGTFEAIIVNQPAFGS